jgi:replicative DNA helicase
MTKRSTPYQTLLPSGIGEPEPIEDVARRFDQRVRDGRLEGYLPVSTGFAEEDDIMGGGFLCGFLLLLTGPQNIGKTIKVVQWARNVALGGDIACVVCYEHPEVHLFHRLLCMESCLTSPERNGITLTEIREAIMEDVRAKDADPVALADTQALQIVLDKYPQARAAFDTHMAHYLDRLYLVQGDTRKTTLEVLERYVRILKEKHPPDGVKKGRVVLFGDYLQRIPYSLDSYGMDRDLQADLVVKGLKGLALEEGVPVVAVSALDKQGLRKRNAWVEDQEGTASLAYEADTTIVMRQLRVDGRLCAGFPFGKNRAGPTRVEPVYGLIGKHFCFDPDVVAVRDYEELPGAE